MTPPALTISTPRRMSRAWGVTGCSSKYWLMGYHTWMQSVLEFAPVAVFGVAYFTHGIYVATAALMISMALLSGACVALSAQPVGADSLLGGNCRASHVTCAAANTTVAAVSPNSLNFTQVLSLALKATNRLAAPSRA